MNFKPFYIKYEDWMTDEQVAEVFDKAVESGASLYEGVADIHSKGFSKREPNRWKYFGVDWENETLFEDDLEDYGNEAVEITLDQVDEHLGIKSIPSANCMSSLRNVKIDLRKEDGSVDEEKSAAFQKAVFETGGQWDSGREIKNTKCSYLFVAKNGMLGWSNKHIYFLKDSKKEVDFQYETITTWTATEKVSKETIEIGGDIYFKEDVVKALSSLKKVGE